MKNRKAHYSMMGNLIKHTIAENTLWDAEAAMKHQQAMGIVDIIDTGYPLYIQWEI